jgi:hypothetical protein
MRFIARQSTCVIVVWNLHSSGWAYDPKRRWVSTIKSGHTRCCTGLIEQQRTGNCASGRGSCSTVAGYLHVYSRPQRSNVWTRSSRIHRWLTSVAVSRHVHSTDMSCAQQCHGTFELRAWHFAQQRRISHVYSRNLRVYKRDSPSQYQDSKSG